MRKRSTIYSPLFGASCPETVRLGDLEIAPMSWEEFEVIEKRDVLMERAGQWVMGEKLGRTGGPAAPPAIISRQRERAEPAPWPVGHGDAVLALRLLGLDAFVDPDHTFWTESQSLLTHRHVAPFRMFGYTRIHEPVDTVTPDTASKTARLIECIREHGYRQVLRPVRLLSGPSLSPNAIVLVALQLLEAVFGRPDRQIAGLDFATRLMRAGLSRTDVDWLADPGPGGGRAVRNAAAHGRPVEAPDAAHFRRVTTRAMCAFAHISPDSAGEDPVDGFQRHLARLS